MFQLIFRSHYTIKRPKHRTIIYRIKSNCFKSILSRLCLRSRHNLKLMVAHCSKRPRLWIVRLISMNQHEGTKDHLKKLNANKNSAIDTNSDNHSVQRKFSLNKKGCPLLLLACTVCISFTFHLSSVAPFLSSSALFS